MTGIGMAAASGAGAAAAPATLTVSTGLTGGTSFNVAGATGSLAGIAAVSLSTTGGTAPVTASVSPVKDAGTGSIALGPYGDGSHQTPAWSGLSVGDSIAFHLDADASDSGTPQQHASGRYPPTGQSIVITRTS